MDVTDVIRWTLQRSQGWVQIDNRGLKAFELILESAIHDIASRLKRVIQVPNPKLFSKPFDQLFGLPRDYDGNHVPHPEFRPIGGYNVISST